VPQIEVTFDIDANGILHVSAKDRASGKEQRIQITGASNLDKGDIERMVQEAAAHAEEDKKQREAAEAKNAADQLVYQTEKSLKDLGDKVPSDQKLDIENKISAVRTALNSGDTDEIKRLTEELRTASYALSELLYKQAAGEAGGAAPEGTEYAQTAANATGGQASGQTSGANDDVIDAEFKQG
jgi:molecular chaperone DnaK